MAYFSPETVKGIFVETSGSCRRRSLDFERFKAFLTANGFVLTHSSAEADVLVFYGCCLNGLQEAATLRRLAEISSSFNEIVTLGGLAKVCKEEVLKQYAGCGSLHRVFWDDIEAMDQLFADRLSMKDVPYGNTSPAEQGAWSIMVGRGCDSGCTYCGDKPIVGPLISFPLDSILEQMRQGLAQGATHFDFVGDDVGAWGRDVNRSIIDLLDAATMLNGDYTITMQEVNIKYLIRHIHEFDTILQREKIPFLVVAFQHVVDRVLALMKRGYRGAEVEALVSLLERHGVKIRFHALVGFPSETAAELERNLQFICSHDFLSGSCFLYRPREYAPSFSLMGHFSATEQNEKMNAAYTYLSACSYRVERKWPKGIREGPPHKLLVVSNKLREEKA